MIEKSVITLENRKIAEYIEIRVFYQGDFLIGR